MAIDSNWLARLRNVPRRVVEEKVSNDPAIERKANNFVNSLITGDTRPARSALNDSRKANGEEAPIETKLADSKSSDNGEERGDSAFISAYFPQTIEESGLVDPNIVWDESQEEALRLLSGKQYGALIGAAGTGKTTLVKALLAKVIYGDKDLALEAKGIRKLGGKQGPSIAICAYTGIATQVIKNNLPDWMAPACKTIHTLLEYAPDESTAEDEEGNETKTRVFLPCRNERNKLDHEVIVIDEASMLGLDLWRNLLAACHPGTRIILIGDINQLKPVADQTMFAFALASALDPNSPWVVAELTKIHRQKEEAANRIIDTAHQILGGELPTFDDPSQVGWRVIGLELPNNAQKAAHTAIALAHQLTQKYGQDGDVIYDPYRDRIMTAGNGEEEDNSASAVQQIQINQVLSRIVEPPSEENPVLIIDAGRKMHRLSVGHRVMATKNEPPSVVDRVTNGMTGRITSIEPNPKYAGNLDLVGPEEIVMQKRRESARRAVDALQGKKNEPQEYDLNALAALTTEGLRANQKPAREGDAPASHVITVHFDNGATRSFKSKAGAESLQLAYATTVHKAQGSQCDTAIIICHHAVKGQLSREWLYTGWTRAVRRVVLLYTKPGLLNAVHKQQIFGKSTQEKVRRYADALISKQGTGALVRLTIEG